MTGRLVFVKRITRDMVRAEPEARFVFGDNVRRCGNAGQAKAMRGEPNAIGVATKFLPTMAEISFFKDNAECKRHALRGLDEVSTALQRGRTVYFPADGIGTGLSELPTRAPKLHAYITDYVSDLAKRFPA